MKRPARAVVIGVASALAGATALGVSANAATAASSAAASSAAQSATHKVIVLLKDQPASAPKNTPAFTARTSKIHAAQASVAKQLKATSKNVHQYQLVNALSATVSSTELSALQSNPDVAQVVPDEVIHGSTPDTATTASTTVPATPRTPPPNTCAPDPAKPMLSPEALQTTSTASDDPTAKTARSLGIDGAGVKVAWMAEGIDINNQDFIRANGQHVFVDYQDFSGDGPNAPTDGAEAFLDASAIGAQGLHSYNIQNFAAVPLSKPCYIRIEGMAPGASMVGLKVFGNDDVAFTSGFLAAIDYAVSVDHVDVLNQSFGSNPLPESAADATRLFDEAAVAAGTTVTVSSGDAGPTNTIGSPSTDPAVISVGGSTNYKFQAQTGYGGYYPLASKGWLNDNVSPLSSSGFTEAGRTIDLLAPGDLDWALCSTDQATYGGCASLAGQAAPIEESGGTSESAPLTAGASALVIQAYRNTHGGKSPTPAEVKQLLTSTSDDVGHAGQDQGAGRLNTYQAVLAAMSVHDTNGSPTRQGNTILTSADQLNATGSAGSSQSFKLTLTNNGASSQKLTLGQRTLGKSYDVQNTSTTLSDTKSNHFTDFAGQTTNYEVVHFSVPSGVDQLNEDYVYPGDPASGLNARVRVALIDPNGTFASHSFPQGVGNSDHVMIGHPVAGTWTAMVWSRQTSVGGTTGKVKLQFAMQKFASTGSVTPASLTLAPGASGTVTVKAKTPSMPGDASNSVTIASSSGQNTSVAVTLRSLVNVAKGGRYSGVLTGGNGRELITGQTQYYQFDVAPSQRDLSANFSYGTKATDQSYGYLVDPSGNVQSFGTNQKVGTDSSGNITLSPLSSMSLVTRAPAPGRWTLILLFAPNVSGTAISVPFSGNVALNTVQASGAGVPNNANTVLKAGQAVTVPVTVKNTGKAPAAYFIDARHNNLTSVNLAVTPDATESLPVQFATGHNTQYLVPTETTNVGVSIHSNRNVNFDTMWSNGWGDPDYAGQSTGHDASVAFSGAPVANGVWSISPQEIGPFGPSGAPAGTVTMAASATTLAFDQEVSTPIGNYEFSAVDPSTGFAVVNVPAGQSLTIPVTITPSGAKGTVVSGQLFVDQMTLVSAASNELGTITPGASELTAIPYRYKIG